MPDPWTLAQAFAEFTAISAAGVLEQLAAVRSAAATAGEDFQALAPGGDSGLSNSLQVHWNPPFTAQAAESTRQAVPPAAADPATEDPALGPETAALGAQLAEAVAGALQAWRDSADELPGNGRLTGSISAAPGAGSTSDSQDSQTELLRDCVEINRSLLELAQGSGIKVDVPDPAWGA